MFDRSELEYVLDVQRRTYELLAWLKKVLPGRSSEGIGKHDSRTASESLAEWIKSRFDRFPPNARPTHGTAQEITEFANMLASYLLTSFDVTAETKIQSGCGCYCPLCVRLVPGTHLQTKKLTKTDKLRATKLKHLYIQRFADECGVSLWKEDVV